MREELVRWVGLGIRDPLLWEHLAGRLLLSLGPPGVCLLLGYGVPALLLLSLGAWPWRFRLSVRGDAVECRWLFAKQLLPLSHIKSVRVRADARHWLVWRRQALVLLRDGASDVVVFAEASKLGALEVAIRAGLARSS